MPVPVAVISRSPKRPAHPVHKSRPGLNLVPLTTAPRPGPLSAPGRANGAAYQLRGRPWEDDMVPHLQDFPKGLAFADNASAIKGSLTDVRTPPFPGMYQEPWSTASHNATPAIDLPFDSERSSRSPCLDDESPQDPSSPVEPLTPFGVFVDRAVSAPSPAIADQTLPSVPTWDADPIIQAPHLCEHEPVNPTNKLHSPQPDISPLVTPCATAEYSRLAEYFSEWIAKFVWKVCTTGMALPESYAVCSRPVHAAQSDDPPRYLAASIYSLLLSTLLEPSAVLLALWYVARLPVDFAEMPLPPEKEREAKFRLHLLGGPVGSDKDQMERDAPFRLVVLGFMLSNKWLSDHTFSNKTWHNISSIPIDYLNTLESLALQIFGYDLSISHDHWSQWLKFVLSYHTFTASPGYLQPISRPTSTPYGLIRKAIEDVIGVLGIIITENGVPQPMFTGIDERRQKAITATAVQEIDLDEDGPLRQEYLPHRNTTASTHNTDVAGDAGSHENTFAGRTLPPPAPWSPAADEPVLPATQRFTGPTGVMVPIGVHPMYGASYEQNQVPSFNQNHMWHIGGYLACPTKPMAVPSYRLEPSYPHHHSQGYNHISFLQSLAMSHSRSHSLSYGQENNTIPCNHMRFSSQTDFPPLAPHNAAAAKSTVAHDRTWGSTIHKGTAPVFPSSFNLAYFSSFRP